MASPPAAPTHSPGIDDTEDEHARLMAGGGNDNANANLMAVRFWRFLRKMFIKSTRILNMSDALYASCISYMSTAAVMAILTLNIYSASYFLAWRKEGSVCHIFPETASAPAPANSLDAVVSDITATDLIKLIVISIPFTGLCLTLCIGGLADVSKEAVQFLGCSAVLLMLEIMYIITLGAIMTACMSNVSGPSVLVTTVVLLVSLVLIWGYCCYHPKCLRFGVFCKCCCTDIDAVDLEPHEDIV